MQKLFLFEDNQMDLVLHSHVWKPLWENGNLSFITKQNASQTPTEVEGGVYMFAETFESNYVQDLNRKLKHLAREKSQNGHNIKYIEFSGGNWNVFYNEERPNLIILPRKIFYERLGLFLINQDVRVFL